MIRTRHLALLAAVAALAYAAQAFAQTPLLVLDYNTAKTYGTVEIAGGAIDLTNGAMIVNTATFGFVPEGFYNTTAGSQQLWPNEYGQIGQPETGDNAIHDALIEGLNSSDFGANPNGGLWNGTNGIMSSAAQNYANTNGNVADVGVGWFDDAYNTTFTSYRGIPITTNESVIATTWLGDSDLGGVLTTVDAAYYIEGSQGIYKNGTTAEWIDGAWNYGSSVTTVDAALWVQTLSNGDGTVPIWTLPVSGPIQPALAGASPVPEPSSALLLGAGLLGSLALARRRLFGRRRRDSAPASQELALPTPTTIQSSFSRRPQMLRRAFTLLAVGAILAGSLLVANQSANATLYLTVKVDPSNTDYTSPYAYTVTSADYAGTTTWTDATVSGGNGVGSGTGGVLLDVYAFIADTTPNIKSSGLLGFAGSFQLASSVLKGDISNDYQNINFSFASTPGAQFNTVYGSLGLGGTSASDVDSSGQQWWYMANSAVLTKNQVYVTSTGLTSSTYAAGDIGTEQYLGSIVASFTSYSAPSQTTSASMVSVACTSYGGANPYGWHESTSTSATTFTSISAAGNAATIGNGPSSPNMIYGAVGTVTSGSAGLAGLQFVFASSVTTVTNNAASIAASLTIPANTVLLGGGTAAVTGSVTNNAVSPADPLNWSTTPPNNLSLSLTSSNGVAQGASNTLTGTLTASTTGFGPWSKTASFAGIDATTTLAASNSPVSQTLNYSIIGLGTKGTTDGNGIKGQTYGTQLFTQGNVSNLALLATTLSSTATISGGTTGAYGINNTTATILAGAMVTPGQISMEWRSRASNETPAGSRAAGGVSAGFLPLYSDVVNLQGVSTSATSPYVLQMTYDPAELGGAGAVANAASKGLLYLGSNTSGTGNGWQNAVIADTGGTGANAAVNYQGSYAAYTASVGAPAGNLANLLGAWGVDTANNDVWAVVDHDAEFAVVPEPGTLALLGAGVAALAFAYRRRKLAKA